jgi:hypothetical protein
MLRAEAQTLDCFRGTIFGREVVPDVCSTRPISSGWAGPPFGAGVAAAPSKDRVKLPAPACGVGVRRTTGTPRRPATATAGLSEPSATTSSLALRSVR